MGVVPGWLRLPLFGAGFVFSLPNLTMTLIGAVISALGIALVWMHNRQRRAGMAA